MLFRSVGFGVGTTLGAMVGAGVLTTETEGDGKILGIAERAGEAKDSASGRNP